MDGYTELQTASMRECFTTFHAVVHRRLEFTFIFFVVLLLNLSVDPSLAEAAFDVTIRHFPHIVMPAQSRSLAPPVEYITGVK
jgi:hypothetical protein